MIPHVHRLHHHILSLLLHYTDSSHLAMKVYTSSCLFLTHQMVSEWDTKVDGKEIPGVLLYIWKQSARFIGTLSQKQQVMIRLKPEATR